jgi:BioD-like phosphotransacetylase family protein
MGRRLFIGATEQHSGKTTMSVCLTHLGRRLGSVGYMKPVGQEYVTVDGREVDKDVALLAAAYGLEDDLPFMSPVVARRDFTRQVLDGEARPEELAARIRACLAELERRHDFVIIEGTGHGGVGSVIGVSNARVARLCDAPVLVVCRGGIGAAVDAVNLNRALYEKEGAAVRVVLVNKLLPDKREQSLRYIGKAFAGDDLAVVGGLDYSKVLANPTLSHVAKALRAPLAGDPTQRRRIVHAIQLGAASTDRCIELLEDATLLVFPSTRDELLVTCSSLYPLPEYHDKLAGLVVSGISPVSRTSQRILDSSHIPYLRVERRTGEVFAEVMETISKTGPEDLEKIEWIQREGERVIDFDSIAARL